MLQVKDTITRFNNGTDKQMEIIRETYTERFLPTVDAIWTGFKRRINNRQPGELEGLKNDKKIKKNFLAVLKHQQALNTTVDLIQKVIVVVQMLVCSSCDVYAGARPRQSSSV